MQLLKTPDEFNDDNILALKVEPARKWNRDIPREDQKQVRDAKDRPLWDISCTVSQPGEDTGNFQVRVPSEAEPVIGPGLIRFGGLKARTYLNKYNNVVSFEADTFTQDPAPSTKRNGAKAEPPVPTGAK